MYRQAPLYKNLTSARFRIPIYKYAALEHYLVIVHSTRPEKVETRFWTPTYRTAQEQTLVASWLYSQLRHFTDKDEQLNLSSSSLHSKRAYFNTRLRLRLNAKNHFDQLKIPTRATFTLEPDLNLLPAEYWTWPARDFSFFILHLLQDRDSSSTYLLTERCSRASDWYTLTDQRASFYWMLTT